MEHSLLTTIKMVATTERQDKSRERDQSFGRYMEENYPDAHKKGIKDILNDYINWVHGDRTAHLFTEVPYTVDNRDADTSWLWINDTDYLEVQITDLQRNAAENCAGYIRDLIQEANPDSTWVDGYIANMLEHEDSTTILNMDDARRLNDFKMYIEFTDPSER